MQQALREYAETPDRFSHIAPGASVERFADERVCILQAPTWASVSGVSVEIYGWLVGPPWSALWVRGDVEFE